MCQGKNVVQTLGMLKKEDLMARGDACSVFGAQAGHSALPVRNTRVSTHAVVLQTLCPC